MAISIWYSSTGVLYFCLFPHILYIRELQFRIMNTVVMQNGREQQIDPLKYPMPVLEGLNGLLKERNSVSRVPHDVRRIQNNVSRVPHGVWRVYNNVSKVSYTVRRVQNAVSRVLNTV